MMVLQQWRQKRLEYRLEYTPFPRLHSTHIAEAMLSITSACTIPIIRNMIGVINEVFLYQQKGRTILSMC